MPVDPERYHSIVQKNLLPLFSGASLEDDFIESTPRESCVAFAPGRCSIYLKPDRNDLWRVTIERSQPFDELRSELVTEHRVCESFVEVFDEIITPGLGKPFEQDLLSTFTRRVVVRSVCRNQEEEAIVLATLDQLEKWSTKLYEGQPIVAAIGFENSDRVSNINLESIWQDDYSAVVTNGYDTLLISDYNGNILDYEALNMPSDPDAIPLYAPYRLGPVADWTGQDKLAIILNRLGEILVLRNRQLTFAKRAGQWHFLTHEPVIMQMSPPRDSDLRKAVYASCLDASFARNGACVGLVTHDNVAGISDLVPRPEDYLENESPKSRFMKKVVKGRPFQAIDRKLRQELLGIDGATILDHHGEVISVGAILKVEKGSTSGGRLAAAVALSTIGAGIKVSQDGSIKGYHNCDNPDEANPDFWIM